MIDTDLEVLFANERLPIGMLQAVSGATVVAAISQWESLLEHAGSLGILIFVTAMAAALLLAALAAYWKHEYKKWDVNAGYLDGEPEGRRDKASAHLNRMRFTMLFATCLILAAVVSLVVALWFTEFPIFEHYEFHWPRW